MPRGRHRHSPPLHRLLPPSTVFGVSAACAVGACLTADPVVLRVLVAAAVAAAFTGAVMMRGWDRAAGKRVAELERARVRDEWRTEERIAELEADVEESRELRQGLEAKLRAKRAELARLRNEHAGLLRRYATAETERASALEGRRLLAIEAASPARALPPGPDDRDQQGAPTPAAYLRASEALRQLARNGARQQAERTVAEARRRDTAAREADEPTGRHAAAGGRRERGGRTAADSDTASEASAPAGPRDRHTVPAAAAVVPYEPRRGGAGQPQGTFDFFGTQSARAAHQRPELTAVTPDDDLADVVGAEAFAEHEAHRARQDTARAATEPRGPERRLDDGRLRQPRDDRDGTEAETEHERPDASETGDRPGGEVIDLTEHDETEQLDLRELRAHSS